MNYQQFSMAFGFSVWLVATLVFRFFGHTFFIIENATILFTFFLGIIPVLWLLIKWVFSRYELTSDMKLKSTVLMAVPGMIADVACLKFHYIVFPTLNIEQAIVLGAWMLWAYVLVLLIGLSKSVS
jgi:hypothetical protein